MGQSARKLKAPRQCAQIAAQCDIEQRSFAIGISDISPEGCVAEADAEWGEDAAEDWQFLHLTIANRIEMNGRVVTHQGRRAEIRFFGQIHPCVVEELAQAAD